MYVCNTLICFWFLVLTVNVTMVLPTIPWNTDLLNSSSQHYGNVSYIVKNSVRFFDIFCIISVPIDSVGSEIVGREGIIKEIQKVLFSMRKKE